MKHLRWKLLVLACAATVAGCKQNQTETPAAEPPKVAVSTPIPEQISKFEVFTGRTQAFNYADIRARVSGYLKEVHFNEGDDVEEGKLLFLIDPRPYDAALNQAKANLTLQQAQLAYNEQDYNRNVDLRKSKSVSQDDLEKSRAAFETAKASVDAAKAAVKTAQLNVDFTKVVAPFNGRISRRQVDRGNDIQADNTVMASVVQMDPMYAYFDVNERILLHIRGLLKDGKVPPDAAEKFPVKLGFADEKPEAFNHKGILKFADNKVDPTTGTLRMWGLFENPKHDLYSGLFIRVRMEMPVDVEEAKKWLFVSEDALGSDQERKYVLVAVRKETADGTKYFIGDERVYVEVGQRKVVKVGTEEGVLIAVKSLKGDDLKGDELVVVNNLQRVRPKMKVEAKLVPMPVKKTEATTIPVNGNHGPK
jgi:RND family efflux transporter MFP subunit